MTTISRLYEFVFRGLLAEEALDKDGRLTRALPPELDPGAAQRLSLDALDERFVAAAQQMAVVYVAVAAFENSVRKLVTTVLLDQLGEDWWERGVSERIRKKADSRRDEEQKIKWHAQRGSDPITYTDLSDLGNIIRNNAVYFEPYMPSAEWASAIFSVLERSRNVIMHSGELAPEDVERLGINIRDWIKQVGV